MRILLLTNALDFGGLEAYLFTLGKALRDLGNEVRIAARKISSRSWDQLAWTGLPKETLTPIGSPTIGPNERDIDAVRNHVRNEGFDLIVTSPPFRFGAGEGDPKPYDLGVPEVCLIHSIYSAAGWLANGRKVFANDELLAARYGGEVLPVPVDLDRYYSGNTRVDFRKVIGAGRGTPETTEVCKEVFDVLPDVAIDYFGGPADRAILDGGLLRIPSQDLTSIYRYYSVCIGAGLVAVEAMASGCLTIVGQDTVRPSGGVGPSFEGLMTPENVATAACYNYRGWQVLPKDRLPGEVAEAVRYALALGEAERLRIVRGCRAWVEERHDARKVARRLLEVALA